MNSLKWGRRSGQSLAQEEEQVQADAIRQDQQGQAAILGGRGQRYCHAFSSYFILSRRETLKAGSTHALIMDSHILRLAATISQSTQILDQYAQENEPRMFSFDADAPARVTIKSKDVNYAKMTAISSCMELIDRLQGPMNCLQPLVSYAAQKRDAGPANSYLPPPSGMEPVCRPYRGLILRLMSP